MKKMMKKIWACLLACTMIVTMLPGLMVNVKAATSYELRIGDTEVTDENLSGAGWSYDPSTKTLTLDGLNCQKSKVGEGVIHSYRDLNLVLKNKNKIENLASALSGNWQSGIRVNGKLTISGSGSLITTGGTGYTSHGISVNSLIINSGTITATGQEAEGSSGIYARNGVTINGGKLIAQASTSSGGSSRGIECGGTFTLNGGNVTASADGATENSYGLQAGSTAKFEYGTIHLKGITAAYKANKISSSSKTYDFSMKKTVTDSDFTFTAPKDLIYDGKEKAATVTGKDGIACGNITVKYYNENGQLMTETPKAVGTYTVKADISGNDEYNEISNVTNSKWIFTISYGTATKDMYSTTGISANGWAKGTVTVRAASGYTIGKTSDLFEESIGFSTNETERVFYIKDTGTGKVYKGSIDYKLDTKAPVISGIESATEYQDSARFTVSDADSGLADVKDGETSLGNSGTYELTTDGVHTITAVDIAGNSTTQVVKVCADHKYPNIKYEWNEDNSKCKASAECTDCGKKVNETVDAKASITKQQSCTDAEITTYTATFTNNIFATQTTGKQTKGALGHTQNADDGDCTTAVTCKRCDYVFIPAKEHDFSGEWQSDQTGHWKACKNDGCTKVDKKAHTANITEPTENEDQICTECGWIIANKLGHLHKRHLEYVKAKEVTCTEDGNKAYYICKEDKKCFADENATNELNESDIVIKASGHDYGDPVYTWSKDHTTCTATIICKKCKDVKAKEEVKTTSEVTKQQSEKQAEITTYTATFTNEAFATQTKEVQTKAVAKPKADGNKINVKANKLTLNSKFSIKTGKSIKVRWGKVKGADGYDVYLSYCGKDKMTLVRSTKSSSVTISKLDKKKINQKNNVKCYVVAYKIVKGKKQEIGKTNLFHAVGRKNKSETEPKNIRLKKTSYVLATGKTAKIKASIVRKNKKLPVIAHTEKIRYATSNAKVATVSKEGKITAKKKGTCYVYVYAINGCAKKVKVTVK